MPALTFDDVLIVPRYSEVESRLHPDTTSRFLDLDTPILSANMDTVTGVEMALAMDEAGATGVLHRFMPKDELLESISKIYHKTPTTAVSVGIGDPDRFAEWCDTLIGAGATVIVVDVAHAHTKNVIDCVKAYGDQHATLVVGNVATPAAVEDLLFAGADWVKVGIGPGAACTTRSVTGVGYPQLTAIEQCAKAGPIIADGGVKNTADFCKAIAAGADAVMCGSLFAGCDEAPGEIIETPDGLRKTYRGSSSAEAREEFGLSDRIAEGKAGSVPYTGPAYHTVEQYKRALQSSMSYVGASNIDEFQKRAEFVEVTATSLHESAARI